MKKLMLSTAILAAMTVAASAQTEPAMGSDGDLFYTENAPDAIRASDFIGTRIYAAQTEFDADAADGVAEDWEDIGEVNDVILGRDGEVEAVLVDIGGFLGMGERQVALSMDAIRFVSDDSTADEQGDFFLVVNAQRPALESAPEYGMADQMPAGTDTAATQPAAGDTAATDTAAAEQPKAGDAASNDTAAAGTEAATEEPAGDVAQTDSDALTEEPAADMAADTEATTEEPANDVAATEPAAGANDGAVADNAITREGYSPTDRGTLTSEMLTGARVYGSDDSDVGDISELILTEDGQITQAVIDVGGFLGIGAKPVAVSMDDLQILHADDGDDVRVYIEMTADQLKALPEYDAG